MPNYCFDFSIYNRIFTDEFSAFEFLDAVGGFATQCLCVLCGSTMERRACNAFKEKCCFFCKNNRCGSKKSIKFNSFFEYFKLPLKIQLRMIFCWVVDFNNAQSIFLFEVSEPTYISFKKKLLQVIEREIVNKFPKIGGLGVVVQVDETAVSRGRIITNPTHANDSERATTMLVGGIEETDEEIIFLKIVPNRRINTIRHLFREKINCGGIIWTDGYPTYPSSTREQG